VLRLGRRLPCSRGSGCRSAGVERNNHQIIIKVEIKLCYFCKAQQPDRAPPQLGLRLGLPEGLHPWWNAGRREGGQRPAARKSSGPNIRTGDTVRRFPPNDSRARGVSRYVRFLFCFFSFFSFLFFSSSFLSSFYVSFIFSLLIVAVSFLLFFLFLFSFSFSFYLFSFLFLFSYFILFFLYLFIFLSARCCIVLFFCFLFVFSWYFFFFILFYFVFFFFPNSCL
jgi:hypothetical protein